MPYNDDNTQGYPAYLLKKAGETMFFGRMNDPTASAYIKGACGDEMEFYLFIRNGIIEDIKFYTEGCAVTRACGAVAAELAVGKGIMETLGISAKQIMNILVEVPEDHKHCSILAVSALYKAVADYLIKY